MELLVLAAVYVVSYFAGTMLEKFRMPWLMAPLVFGALASAMSMPVPKAVSSFSEVGMLFLLFIIGYEFDFRRGMKDARTTFPVSIAVVAAETVVVGLFLWAVFDLSLPLSLLVAMTFSTVGEGLLVPILEETGMIKRVFGRMLIEIGMIDDIFEIFSLLAVVAITGSTGWLATAAAVASLVASLIIVYFLGRMGVARRIFRTSNLEESFLVALSVLFTLSAIGQTAGAESIAALFAGMLVGHFMPEKKRGFLEETIKAASYGLFVPVFFFSVGYSVNFSYFSWKIAALIVLSALPKILISVFSLRSKLGPKSLAFGIGLTTRFSTGIVAASILASAGYISPEIYTLLVSASSVFALLTPPIFHLMIRD